MIHKNKSSSASLNRAVAFHYVSQMLERIRAGVCIIGIYAGKIRAVGSINARLPGSSRAEIIRKPYKLYVQTRKERSHRIPVVPFRTLIIHNDHYKVTGDANHTSVDPEVRLEAFKTVQHAMGDKALTIPLYTAMAGVGANKDLQGVAADAMGEYRIIDWSWAE